MCVQCSLFSFLQASQRRVEVNCSRRARRLGEGCYKGNYGGKGGDCGVCMSQKGQLAYVYGSRFVGQLGGGRICLPLGDLSGLVQGATLNLPGMVSWRYMTAARQVGSSDCRPHFAGHICRMYGASDMDGSTRETIFGSGCISATPEPNNDKYRTKQAGPETIIESSASFNTSGRPPFIVLCYPQCS